VILSKEALDRVVERAFDDKHEDCKNIDSVHAEDDINISENGAIVYLTQIDSKLRN
jgi:hypothetical protein